MSPREVVGSRKVEALSIDMIGGPATIFSRNVKTAGSPQKPKSHYDDASLPSNAFVCRYKLRKRLSEKQPSSDDDHPEYVSEVVPYSMTDDNQDDEDDEEINDEDLMELDSTASPEQEDTVMKQDEDGDEDNENNQNNDTMEDDDDSSDSSSDDDDDEKPGVVAEGEGSTLKGQILVGPQHQVEVPPYDPAKKAEVKSRNPTMVWKPNNPLSNEQLDEYFAKASDILTPYAEQNQLTMGNHPFTSVSADHMEVLMRNRKNNAPLTVSAISTASSLSSDHKMNSSKNNLLRECDVDALLSLLHEKNYGIAAALEALAAKPLDYLSAWTVSEKEKFDNGFRKYAGALRMIAAKSIGPTKSCQDVIDYHYRFKIPDQFRRYQDKKREQAVRMMECIETRRFHDSTATVNIIQLSATVSDTDGGGKGGDPTTAMNTTDANASGGDDMSQPPDAKRRKYGNW